MGWNVVVVVVIVVGWSKQRDCSLYQGEIDNKNLGNKLIGDRKRNVRSKDAIELDGKKI